MRTKAEEVQNLISVAQNLGFIMKEEESDSPETGELEIINFYQRRNDCAELSLSIGTDHAQLSMIVFVPVYNGVKLISRSIESVYILQERTFFSKMQDL